MREEFLSPREVKRRSGVTAELARRVAFERNQRWVGWTGEVLVDEVGKVSGSWVGRNFAYKPVVVRTDGSESLLGRIVRARVGKAFPTYLEAEIVQ
ncbi:TRAM domain-containing protein, partial [Candidatus Bathyarchaeota archaeon]|nr:TRAM domain-containing protein [Candidatus Bathyarchaeota archaeon]